jgi:hypothetical protein
VRNLLWKEWHEQAWQLAFGCVVLSAMAAIGLHARMVADSTMVDWVCFLGVMGLPVLASTALVPAERADGGLATLVALPVSPARILAAKTVVGLLLCVGPLLVAAAVSVAMAGGREMYTGAVVELSIRSALASAVLFGWMFALTVRLPNEARAALISVGVLVIWVLASVGLTISAGVRSTAFAASPFAFFDWTVDRDGMGPWPQLPVVVGVQLLLMTGLCWMAVRLFGSGTAST